MLCLDHRVWKPLLWSLVHWSPFRTYCWCHALCQVINLAPYPAWRWLHEFSFSTLAYLALFDVPGRRCCSWWCRFPTSSEPYPVYFFQLLFQEGCILDVCCFSFSLCGQTRKVGSCGCVKWSTLVGYHQLTLSSTPHHFAPCLARRCSGFCAGSAFGKLLTSFGLPSWWSRLLSCIEELDKPVHSRAAVLFFVLRFVMPNYLKVNHVNMYGAFNVSFWK